MEEEKRILNYFLIWLFFGFLICFVGITDVFAASYDVNNYTAQLYDNLGPTLNEMNTSKDTDFYYGYTGLTAYSSGGAWGISSPIPLIANHTYSMTVDPYAVGCGFTILSSYPRLGIGTSLANAKTSYQNNTNVNEKFSQAVSNSRYLQYVFTPSINASYIVFPFATTSSCTSNEVQLSTIVIEDLGETGVSQDQINTSLNNQTNELNNSIQNSTDTITGEINDMENAIIDSNKETQEVIKDQFNSCRPSVNLFNFNNVSQPQADTTIEIIDNNKGIVKLRTESKYHYVAVLINGLEKNTNYTFSGKFTNSNTNMKKLWFSAGNTEKTITFINGEYSSGTAKTFNTGDNTSIIIYLYASGSVGGPNEATWYDIQLEKGDTSTTFEPYGEEICKNKLDEQNETSKGIWATIKDLPNSFMNMLKGLFIPEDDYFKEWFNELKLYFENKLGFLVTPFSIIIDFINRYLELNPKDDIIINVPDINVPNFEDNIIIEKTSLNWSQLLKSKESLNMLWELYLAFIDVFLILNFINLCENKYNRIFGGDTTQYEYYTVEESYTINDNTGEATNHRLNERKTTRKRVN